MLYTQKYVIKTIRHGFNVCLARQVAISAMRNIKIFLPVQDDSSGGNRIISLLNLIWSRSQGAWELTLPVALVVPSADEHGSQLTPFVLREIQIAVVWASTHSLTLTHTHTEEETDEGDELG